MLALSIPSIAVASPTASAPKAATTATTASPTYPSSLSAASGTAITTSPPPVVSVSAKAKVKSTTLSIACNNYGPYINQPFIIMGTLKNNDKTAVVGTQSVNLWFYTAGDKPAVFRYFGSAQCQNGIYRFSLHLTGQSTDPQQWAFLVQHTVSGSEGASNSKFITLVGHKLPTKFVWSKDNDFGVYSYKGKSLNEIAYNGNFKGWVPNYPLGYFALGGKPVWLMMALPSAVEKFQSRVYTEPGSGHFGGITYTNVAGQYVWFRMRFLGDSQYAPSNSIWKFIYLPTWF